jgi:tRNA(Ile)-lysidine synthase
MIVESLRQFLAEFGIAPCRLIAAVSGGADSTALLVALADLRAEGFDVTAAHLNHRLRGAESDADETWVRDLCARLAVNLDLANGALDDAEVKQSGIEAAARAVRTRRLLEIKDRRGADYVATAHQKNDQAETVLMRLFTGSGLSGLRAIHPIRADGFIRPLLGVTRADVDAFLAERGLVPRADSSNADPRYLRNRIRATLRDYDPSVVENLAAVAAQAARLWPIVEQAIDRCEVERTENETRFLSLPEDPAMREALLHRHIHRLERGARDVSASDITRLAGQLETVERVTVTKSLELIRRNGIVVLRSIPQPIEDYEYGITAGQQIVIEPINATFKITKATRQPGNPATQPFQLPKNATPTFTVRNRRDGDRFRPLGLGGEKKLKDLLIDRKVSAEERDRIPLLLWNGEIVWVAGVEISESFKIDDSDADRYEASVVVQSTAK